MTDDVFVEERMKGTVLKTRFNLGTVFTDFCSHSAIEHLKSPVAFPVAQFLQFR